MFYIVATPIGNLQDLSNRAIDVLKTSDLILCEDTRHSKKLLDHFKIQTPLKSYHKFNEKAVTEQILPLLQQGKKIALISDAGMPLISDPGHVLIEAIIEHELEMTVIPGASSILNALVLSGFNLSQFQFCGFVPKKNKQSYLANILTYPGLSVLFETNKRISDTLQLIGQLSEDRKLIIAKELTKKFEEITRGSAKEVLEKLPQDPLGEYVIVIDQSADDTPFDALSIEKHLSFLEDQLGCSKKDAIKIAAKMRKENKSELYQKVFTK